MHRPEEHNTLNRELLKEAMVGVELLAELLNRSGKLIPRMHRILTELLQRCSNDQQDIVIYQTLTNLRRSIGVPESTLRDAIKKAGIKRSGHHGQSYSPNDVHRIYEVRRKTCSCDEMRRWKTMLSMLRVFAPQASLHDDGDVSQAGLQAEP